MTSAGIKRKEGGEKIHLESWWRGFSPFDWNTYPRGIIPMYLSGRVGIEIQKKKKKREEGWVGSARVGGEVRAPLKFMLGILAVVPGQFFFQLQPRAILCPPPSPFLHTYTLHATLYSQLFSLSLPPSLERAALSLSLSHSVGGHIQNAGQTTINTFSQAGWQTRWGVELPCEHVRA